MIKKTKYIILSHLRLLVLLNYIIVIVGCSTLSGIYTHKGPAFKKIETIPEGKGLVYIYRPPGIISGAYSLTIYAYKVLSVSSIYKEWTAGNNITILKNYRGSRVIHFKEGKSVWESYGHGKTNFFKVDRTTLPKNHEILQAHNKGIPIVQRESYIKTSKNASYYPHIVDAGEILYNTSLGTYIKLDVQPGQTYYIKITPGVFKLVPQNIGENEIIKCNLITREEN